MNCEQCGSVRLRTEVVFDSEQADHVLLITCECCGHAWKTPIPREVPQLVMFGVTKGEHPREQMLEAIEIAMESALSQNDIARLTSLTRFAEGFIVGPNGVN